MSSMLPSLALILWYTSTIHLSSANFNCITKASAGYSGTADDTYSWTECSSYPYTTLVSCGCKPKESGESDSDLCVTKPAYPDRCYAYNGNGGGGVRAYARCCDFTHIPDLSCIAVDMGAYAYGLHGKNSMSCGVSSHEFLTGCTCSSPWSSADGCYGGTRNPYTNTPVYNSNYYLNDYCTAVNGDAAHTKESNKGTKGHLICCDSPTYDIKCFLRYGLPSAGSEQNSYANCATGYTMTGCSGYGNQKSINTMYISGDECIARSHDDTKPVWAIAICCRLETDSPTTDPTTLPTPAPTKNPTPAPTPAPTKDPSSLPTIDPTVNPTVNPTSQPTTDPTIDPSVNPTFDPTLDPTVDPTLQPSLPPTKAPSGSPTLPPTRAPTPICPNLAVGITGADAVVGFDKFDYEGLYVFMHNSTLSHPVFIVPQRPHDQNIQYHGSSPDGHWVIEGLGDGELSYGPTNLQYPPYGAESSPWSHNILTSETFTVLIECVESFAPIAAPTSSPSAPPTIAPTFSPTLSPTTAPSDSPSAVPSFSPTEAPSTPPTAAPSSSPSNAPSLAPTSSPTSFCRTLTVSVSELDGDSVTSSQWDGMYVLDEFGELSYGLWDWSGDGTAKGGWIKYIGSYWILSGINLDTLSYLEVNDVDNYPPIGTKTWRHFAEERKTAIVNILCSDTYSPTQYPTDDPSSAPSFAPTYKYAGVYIVDRPDSDDLYDDWLYVDASMVNGRQRFVYSFTYSFSELMYDETNGWQIETRIGADPKVIYISQRHRLEPPFNEWIYFNSTDGIDRIEVYISAVFTGFPTIKPTDSPVKPTTKRPVIDPATVPTRHPTMVPTSAPTVAPSNAPTSRPTPICDVLTINVPDEGFTDAVATQIFTSSFVYGGIMHSSYPYWSIDCNYNDFSRECDDNGYSGNVYFNGNDQWIISIHSRINDYYKLYSTYSAGYMVPLSSMWTDIESPSDISRSKYRFRIECDLLATPQPTSALAQHIVKTSYVYRRAWFWIAIVLIILFVAVCGIFIWIFCNKLKREPSVVHFDGNPHDIELHKGDDLGEDEIQTKRAQVPSSTFTTDDLALTTPQTPDIPPEIPEDEPEEAGDGDKTTTGDYEWEEDPDLIFKC